MDSLPFLIFNKMMDRFDFGAILCWSEVMFNRTYIHPKPLARVRRYEQFYKNIPQVKYINKHHKIKKLISLQYFPFYNIFHFNCPLYFFSFKNLKINAKVVYLDKAQVMQGTSKFSGVIIINTCTVMLCTSKT